MLAAKAVRYPPHEIPVIPIRFGSISDKDRSRELARIIAATAWYGH
jgi:hypothetical protein